MARIPSFDFRRTAGKSRFRTVVRGLLALVASCLLLVWVGSTIWDNLERNESLRLIRSGTTDERRLAAGNLRLVTRDSEIDRAIAALMVALGDEDAQVRAEAIGSLGSLVCQSRDRGTASAEPGQLEKRIDVAMRGVIPMLSDPDAGVRTAAVIGLAVMTSGATPPPELVAALRDESALVRAAAARALVRFGSNLEPEIPILLAMMERDEADVRRACAEALRAAQLTPALVPTLIEFLGSPDRDVRSVTAELLGRIGPEARGAIPALITVLREPFRREGSDRSRAGFVPDPDSSAARALGKMGPSREAIAALIEMIAPEKVERLLSAVPGIDQVGPPAVDIRAVFAELSRIRAAVQGLGEIGPPAAAAVPALIAAYNQALAHQHTLAQFAIPAALGRIAPNTAAAPDAVAVLVRALDAKDRSMRLSAVQALGQFGQDASAAIPKLRALQDDSDTGVRSAAAKSLAALGVSSRPNADAGRAG